MSQNPPPAARLPHLCALLVAAAALLLPACVTTGDALYVDASGRRSGEKIYSRRCGECHALFAPSSHDKAGWLAVMGEMSDRAHLSDEDEALVLDYLLARG